MEQLTCASLSHTRYWYEVGMLKYRRFGVRGYLLDHLGDEGVFVYCMLLGGVISKILTFKFCNELCCELVPPFVSKF